MRWTGFPAFALLITATFAAAQPAAPTAAASEDQLALAVDIGENTSRIELLFELPLEDEEAARQFARGELDDHACRLLESVRLQGAPLCVWFNPLARATGGRRQISIVGDRFRIRLSAIQRTENLLMTYVGLRLAMERRALRDIRFTVTARPPYAIAGANPLPNVLDEDRASYLVARDSPRATTIQVMLREGPPALPLNAERRSSLFDSVRTADGRNTPLFRSLFSFTGGTLELLLPLLLAWGLLVRARAAPAIGQRRHARRTILLLAALCATPLGLFGGPALFSLLFGTPDATLAIAIAGPLSSEIGFWVARRITICIDALLMASILTALLYLVQMALRSTGFRLPLPWIRLPAAAFMLAAFIEGLLLLLEILSPGEPLPAPVPYELYLLPSLILATAAIFLFARRFIRLSGAPRVIPPLAALLFAIAAIPWSGLPDTGGWGPSYSEMLLATHLFQLQPLAPLAGIVTLVLFLRMRRAQSPLGASAMLSCLAGGAIFAASLSPRTSSWSGLAAGLFAFALVWPRVALCSRMEARARARHLGRMGASFGAWVERLEKASALKSVARRSALDTKLGEGALTPRSWSAKRKALEIARDRAIEDVQLGDGLQARDIVLGTSLEPDPWRSGLRAMAYGLPILLLLGILRMIQAEHDLSAPAPLLAWVTSDAPPVAKMTAASFLFGYFFDRLRGGTGLHKALYFGAAYCLAESVLWIPRFADPAALAGMTWTFSQHFLLLIPIGVLAFDHGRMRQVEGPTFDWRRFSWFGDPRLLSAGTAASAAALAPIIASLFSESFAGAVREMLTAVVPVIAPS